MSLFDDSRARINPALIERYFFVDGAKWVNHEFITLSPLRKDRHIKTGTFRIDEKGLWFDSALTPPRGGDFFELLAGAYNITTTEAAKMILRDTGGAVPQQPDKPDKPDIALTPTATPKPKKIGEIAPQTNEIEVLLLDKTAERYNVQNHGDAKLISRYINIDNEWILSVVRYERVDKDGDGKIIKETVPYYFTGKEWKPGRPDNLRIPFFGEQHLKNNSKPILIVEGEPCASIKSDPVRDKYCRLSWIGGCGSVGKQDWKWLASAAGNNPVIIWPDADDPGRHAAVQIQKELELKREQCKVLQIPDTKPQGWDIKDAFTEGLDILKFIDHCSALYGDMPETEYQAFCMAMDAVFGAGNVEQFDGYYWVYSDKKHFWQARSKKSIESDIQKWIEKNLIPYLNDSETRIHTFKNNVISFLDSYERDYYFENPFKNSALQPFIHIKNGCIEMNKGRFIFHSRTDKDEQFFRGLYPLDCLDIEYDPKYTGIDAIKNIQKTAPMFYKYATDIIPDEHKSIDATFETIMMLGQIMGYAVNPEKLRPYFFAFYGVQGSGKTFFADMLKTIIQPEFWVERPMKDLDTQFGAAQLWGAKCYIDDDVKAGMALPDDKVKQFTGQKFRTIEEKNKAPVKGVRFSVAMFFLSNHQFQFQGGIEGVERRTIYINFKKVIAKQDLYMLEKLKGVEPHSNGIAIDERPAILGLILFCIQQLYKDSFIFTMPEWVKKDRQEWVNHSSTYMEFLIDEILENKSVQRYATKEMYDKYKAWSTENNVKNVYGRTNFHEKMKQVAFLQYGRDGNGAYYKVTRELPVVVSEGFDDDVDKFEIDL